MRIRLTHSRATDITVTLPADYIQHFEEVAGDKPLSAVLASVLLLTADMQRIATRKPPLREEART